MSPNEALDYLSNTYGTNDPKAAQAISVLRALQDRLVALETLTLTATAVLRDEASDELNRFLENLASRRGR